MNDALLWADLLIQWLSTYINESRNLGGYFPSLLADGTSFAARRLREACNP